MSVKWGWVPNIPGTICSGNEVKDKILRKKYGMYTYTYDSPKSEITAASDKLGTVVIKIRDEGGICSLEIKESRGMEYDIRDEVWIEFRKMLDGCSDTVCNCDAMDQLADAGESEAEQAIAKAFIESMETTFDACRIMNEPKTREGWKKLALSEFEWMSRPTAT